MGAVGMGPSVEIALGDITFVSLTCYFIHPDDATALSKFSATVNSLCLSKSKLTANNVSISQVPLVIANCAPCSIVEDLDSSRLSSSINKPNSLSLAENKSFRIISLPNIILSYLANVRLKK